VPDPKPNQEPARPGRPGSKLPVWWGVSIVFHGALLIWVIFFSPVRVIDLSKKAADTVGPAAVHKVAEQVREKQKQHLVEKVRKLEDIKKELAKLEDRKRDEFRQFKQAQTNSTPPPPPATPEQLAQRKEDIARSQTNGLAPRLHADNFRTNTAWAGGTNQFTAATNQFAQNQNAAARMQTNAFGAQTNAEDGRLAAAQRAWTNGLSATAAQIARMQAAATQAQMNALAAQTNANAVFAAAAQKGKIDDAGAIANPQEQIKAAQDDVREAQNQALDALAAGSTNFDSAYHAQVEANTLKEESAQTQLQANAARQLQQQIQNKSSRGRQQAAFRLAASLQAQAAQLQAQAQQAEAQAGAAVVAAGSGKGAPPNHSDSADLDAMKMDQLYQHAEQTEAGLTESYRRLRATELAMLRQIPLSRAMELTETTRAEHPALHDELQNIETNTSDLTALAAAVNAANAEVGAMNNLGQSLLTQAQALDDNGSQSAGGASISLDNIKAEAAHELAMENAADADGNQHAMDVSGMMQTGVANGRGQYGSGGRQGTTTGQMSSYTDNYRNGPRDTGGGGAAVPSIPPKRDIAPGRVVASGGESKKFLFLDSWYIIGPFDNTGRANIDRKFPPETVIDLNATYPGKHGYPVHWEFYQAAQPQVTPPFEHYNFFDNLPASQRHDARYHDLEQIVYYAYTELKFDADCDLWLAIGSDDYSKLWINDQQVWASGKGLQAWSVDQGFRKVHFNRGVNRILYRVENGKDRTDFSLVICLPP
jgi:hypothetical protein